MYLNLKSERGRRYLILFLLEEKLVGASSSSLPLCNDGVAAFALSISCCLLALAAWRQANHSLDETRS